MLPRAFGFQGFSKKNRSGSLIPRVHLRESLLQMIGKRHIVLASLGYVHQTRKQIQTAGCFSDSCMTIKLLYFRARWALEKWICRVLQLDRNSGRLLVNAVDNIPRHAPVTRMTRQNQKSAKTMVNETLHCLKVNALHGIFGECNRAWELHVIR